MTLTNLQTHCEMYQMEKRRNETKRKEKKKNVYRRIKYYMGYLY